MLLTVQLRDENNLIHGEAWELPDGRILDVEEWARTVGPKIQQSLNYWNGPEWRRARGDKDQTIA